MPVFVSGLFLCSDVVIVGNAEEMSPKHREGRYGARWVPVAWDRDQSQVPMNVALLLQVL